MKNNITVVGIGRLGICSALCFEKRGYNVLGVDVNPDYILQINNKTLYSHEPKLNEYLRSSNNFNATTSLKDGLNFSDMIFIVVPTPNGGGDKFYDHSILSNLLNNINKLKPKNKHFIITCTVMPKYIDTVAKELIKDCENCTLSYNPEFIAQGDIINGMEKPDIVLIGAETEIVANLIEEIYVNLCDNKPIICKMKPLEAEITKIAINGFITTKIAYANMIGEACENCCVDKYRVMNAVGSDSRIGKKYSLPDYSYGGPCFPRDTKALSQFLESINIDPLIPLATHELNQNHIKFQAEQLFSKNLNEYIFEDICYKKNSNIPIIEESAKLKIAQILAKRGKNVIIKDEKHMIDEVRKEYGNIFTYQNK